MRPCIYCIHKRASGVLRGSGRRFASGCTPITVTSTARMESLTRIVTNTLRNPGGVTKLWSFSLADPSQGRRERPHKVSGLKGRNAGVQGRASSREKTILSLHLCRRAQGRGASPHESTRGPEKWNTSSIDIILGHEKLPLLVKGRRSYSLIFPSLPFPSPSSSSATTNSRGRASWSWTALRCPAPGARLPY